MVFFCHSVLCVIYHSFLLPPLVLKVAAFQCQLIAKNIVFQVVPKMFIKMRLITQFTVLFASNVISSRP